MSRYSCNMHDAGRHLKIHDSPIFEESEIPPIVGMTNSIGKRYFKLTNHFILTFAPNRQTVMKHPGLKSAVPFFLLPV